ncbi:MULTISPECIES: MFS transporter [Acidithiobacillus]|uniref:Inner membrane transport protein YajR n=1 Tax=Acidithiobacillus ferridurans TaxID=1232575 RepID=A0A2Z6IGG2_ACIFI|nr:MULTISPECIES: MFS transporter [Acidithiobacillus]MBU2851021.1 MFS transporter [Acidithiobacillus ferrivorans]MCR2831568.1 MFS transporter [Acidithiobacillus ferrooxidans]OFA15247.1 MFS transporter [Acidithiobacillus ferrivorans]BBF63874.1 Inner membrane transport protein YajR [Acidithiobacillus ferridurans]
MAAVQNVLERRERRSIFALAGIFGLRLLGLFLVLPVFSVYAHGLHGAMEHPALIGIALGAYGLTQAMFQIPFGKLSDKWGRKPVIAAGLVIFAIGSVIAAQATSIEWLLVGRIVQGAGAVAAAIIALTADLVREERWTKAMAIIGITIGISFSVSLVLSAPLAHWIGVQGIFWVTAALSILAIGVLYKVIPEVPARFHRDAEMNPAVLGTVLRDPNLLRLNYGIFALHTGLTAIFVVLPLVLVDSHHPLLSQADQWMLYLPVMLLSFVAMVPFIIVGEAKRKLKEVFVLAVAILVASVVWMALSGHNIWSIAIALFLFFVGFNILEASLPSLVAKFSHPGAKGTATGVYTTAEFFGAFCGGLLGGLLYLPGQRNYSDVFWAVAVIYLIWLVVALTMRSPRYVATRIFPLPDGDRDIDGLTQRLLQLPGVAEVAVFPDEGAVYCKVESKVYDEERLRAIITATT